MLRRKKSMCCGKVIDWLQFKKKKKKHLLFNWAIRKNHIADLKSQYCEADTSVTFVRLSQVIGIWQQLTFCRGCFQGSKKSPGHCQKKMQFAAESHRRRRKHFFFKKKKYMFTSGLFTPCTLSSFTVWLWARGNLSPGTWTLFKHPT